MEAFIQLNLHYWSFENLVFLFSNISAVAGGSAIAIVLAISLGSSELIGSWSEIFPVNNFCLRKIFAGIIGYEYDVFPITFFKVHVFLNGLYFLVSSSFLVSLCFPIPVYGCKLLPCLKCFKTKRDSLWCISKSEVMKTFVL